MPVSILCVGDLHYHTTNMELAIMLTKKIVAAVKKTKPDIVVFLGDTLHTNERLHVQPLNEALNLFRTVANLTKTFLLIGNHDLINKSQFLTENHGFNALKEWKLPITVVDKPTFHTITKKDDTYTFVFMPYVPPGRFVEALNSQEEVWEGADAIFAHQEFKGCKMNMTISENGDEWEEDYPPVFSGHIHSSQYVAPNIYYVGSAMQQNFGEAYDKRVWLVTFDSSEEECFTYSEIDLRMPRKRTVELDMDTVEEFDPKQYKGDILKLSLVGDTEKFKSFKKTKKYRELIKACSISHKATEKVKEENVQENSLDYKEILFSLISKSKLQQKMFEEATGETYIKPVPLENKA